MKSEINSYNFKEGLPQEFELLDIDQLYSNCEELMTSAHRTDFYQILWFQKGRPLHLVDFHPVQVEPNTILFLNKSIVQRFDIKRNFEGKAILFTDEFFCRSDDDTKFLRRTVLFNDLFSIPLIDINEYDQTFRVLFEQIALELNQLKDPYQVEILKSSLKNLLLHSERIWRKQDFTEVQKSSELEYVMLFKDLLEKNFHMQKQVADYAGQLYITPKKLNKATSSVLGKSPKQMIDERIVLEAKRLLAHSNQNTKEIGFHLGFDEPTNFIKYFKKHQNQTPLEFRERFSQ